MTMFDSNGSEKYSLDLNQASLESAMVQYKQLDTEDVVVFTGGRP
jgi:hypothetical protein